MDFRRSRFVLPAVISFVLSAVLSLVGKITVGYSIKYLLTSSLPNIVSCALLAVAVLTMKKAVFLAYYAISILGNVYSIIIYLVDDYRDISYRIFSISANLASIALNLAFAIIILIIFEEISDANITTQGQSPFSPNYSQPSSFDSFDPFYGSNNTGYGQSYGTDNTGNTGSYGQPYGSSYTGNGSGNTGYGQSYGSGYNQSYTSGNTGNNYGQPYGSGNTGYNPPTSSSEPMFIDSDTPTWPFGSGQN